MTAWRPLIISLAGRVGRVGPGVSTRVVRGRGVVGPGAAAAHRRAFLRILGRPWWERLRVEVPPFRSADARRDDVREHDRSKGPWQERTMQLHPFAMKAPCVPVRKEKGKPRSGI